MRSGGNQWDAESGKCFLRLLRRSEKSIRGQGRGNLLFLIDMAFNLTMKDGSIDVLMNNYMVDLIPKADMDKVLTESISYQKATL